MFRIVVKERIAISNTIAVKYVSLSNPLTEEQKELLKNNVIVLTSALSSLPAGTIIFKGKSYGTYYHNICIYEHKIVQLEWFPSSGSFNIRDGGVYFVDGKLYSNYLNGKTIPQYPSATGTFSLKCVDGVLTWIQES